MMILDSKAFLSVAKYLLLCKLATVVIYQFILGIIYMLSEFVLICLSISSVA